MSNTNYNCSICQEEIFLEENEIVTVCGHGFHTQCLWKSVNTKPVCPICRCDIPFIINYNIALLDANLENHNETMEYMMMEIDFDVLKNAISKFFPNAGDNFILINNGNVVQNNDDLNAIEPTGNSPNFFNVNILIAGCNNQLEPEKKNVLSELYNLSGMDHEYYMKFCNRKIGNQKQFIFKLCGENEQINLNAFLIKKLKNGSLFQLETPYCINVLRKRGSTLPNRFYFIDNTGKIFSMTMTFESSKKLPSILKNIDQYLDGLKSNIDFDSSIVSISKS